MAAMGLDVSLVAPTDLEGRIDGVRVIGVPRVAGRLKRMTLTTWRVFRAALKCKANICHFHDPELIPVGFLLKLFGRSVVYDIHEDYPQKIADKYWIHPLAVKAIAKAISLLEDCAARLFDGVAASNPNIAARFPKDKTVMVQNFPSFDEFPTSERTPYKERPLRVCYVGGLYGIRGLFDMIDSVEKLDVDAVDDDAPLLTLAGRFDISDEEKDSKNRAGWRRTEHLGWLDRGGVSEVLGRSRAGLSVLHANPCYEHTYATKIFEYMVSGLPVIASDFPVNREVLDDGRCGLLVPPSDPEALAETIRWVFEHEKEAEEIGKRGRQRAEALYSWESESQNLFALYQKISPKHHRARSETSTPMTSDDDARHPL